MELMQIGVQMEREDLIKVTNALMKSQMFKDVTAYHRTIAIDDTYTLWAECPRHMPIESRHVLKGYAAGFHRAITAA